MNLIKKIICKVLPELRPLFSNDIDFQWIESSLKNVQRDDLTKLYKPYKIWNSKIGKGTYISYNSRILNTTIGNFCSIGPNLIGGWGIHPLHTISTSPYFYSTLKQNGSSLSHENLIKENKEIKIGNDVFIGANVIILDGITIGDGAVIGAGAVVSKDIPDYAIAVGVPIKIIKYRFSEVQISKLKGIAWWDFDEKKLNEVHKLFFNIDEFIDLNSNKF